MLSHEAIIGLRRVRDREVKLIEFIGSCNLELTHVKIIET